MPSSSATAVRRSSPAGTSLVFGAPGSSSSLRTPPSIAVASAARSKDACGAAATVIANGSDGSSPSMVTRSALAQSTAMLSVKSPW